MKVRGWLPGLNTDPYAIQQAVTAVHRPFVDNYLTDLRDAVAHVRSTMARGHSTQEHIMTAMSLGNFSIVRIYSILLICLYLSLSLCNKSEII